ncbi:pyridoxamine 5'-phosphate oxidase [Leptolyngbya sp. FACHB-321]|uniref:Npun_F5749 family FMN-dependent PPOX-type flavoprotein n=1 Tax=Leptolyngbya sp. FACHB-321 TaxID=2692807 RepID=UPI0016883CEE|nr:Npun_F5749 family FMN-dependent PPOX-type flavoprotein [Leptolyngbya sp. FACHB-321]MBD2035884.1 pyridoxamine 5'-phosphate oxidase [Leptolyngbya sp. FACHB-321]
MSLASWRSPLARALHRNRALVYARYLQLATVRADQRPANRTLVFRGFLDGTNQLQFVTDARNEKAEQIDQLAWGEACWYFPETREQFRLAGTLLLVREQHSDAALQEARWAAWQTLSDAARTQFAWAHPGKPRTDQETFNVAAPDATMPLPHFCLLLLDPYQVDHLELRGDPQNRWLHQCDNAVWTMQAINP